MPTKSKGEKQLQMAMAATGTPKTGGAVSTGDKQPQKAKDATGKQATPGVIPPELNREPTSGKSAPSSQAHSVPAEERRYPIRDRSAPSSPQQAVAPPKKRAKTNSPLQVTHPLMIIQMII